MNVLKKTYRVFVYGTLRNGQRNHRLLQKAVFLGTGKTETPFQMRQTWHSKTDLGIPFVSKNKKLPHRKQVVGELYEVNSETLTYLDQLEGHPRFYKRELTTIILPDGTCVEAWLYFCDTDHGEVNISGDFIAPKAVSRSLKRSEAVYRS